MKNTNFDPRQMRVICGGEPNRFPEEALFGEVCPLREGREIPPLMRMEEMNEEFFMEKALRKEFQAANMQPRHEALAENAPSNCPGQPHRHCPVPSGRRTLPSVAYAYIMPQEVTSVFDNQGALACGTLFPDLHIPKGMYGPRENEMLP